ncbi:putative methyl- binding domain-containing protein 4 protein [Neofusicoccum parvum UCRNP2]|uniref:Putative methyl-binding domain-containing protein 4 protein n=1 Tax=Botryosphaeria parva (strain UCR-NP2) TaxID=1287680 RepID=R1EN41_BOTPV|nr:putative methyl- binding domain-containing protein 4 protein [Neofusicoccum parvum UCRNP2]
MNYPTKGAQRDIKPFEILGDDDPRVAAFEIAHLPGCGAYALDSWRIFCRDPLRGVALDWNGAGVGDEGFEPEWKRVRPTDKELRAFLRWMWLREGWAWNSETGERRLASTEEARSAAERWRWDQERGEEVWVDGDDTDETQAATDGGDVDMADADADELLSGPHQHGKAGRVVITKAAPPTAFHGAVEDDDEADSVFDADDEDEDEAAADQLAQEANARPSQTELHNVTRPSQWQSRPSATAQEPSPTSTQHAVIRKEDDGAAAEEATSSSDAASASDEREDGATTADENGGNSSYGGVGGVARLFRRAERSAKHFFRGVVEETPQPESPAKKERRRAAADDNEEEAMVDSSPIEYRDDDDDEMEGADEHGDARQASPEL